MSRHSMLKRIAEVVSDCRYASRRLLELQIPWLNYPADKKDKRHAGTGMSTNKDRRSVSTAG